MPRSPRRVIVFVFLFILLAVGAVLLFPKIKNQNPQLLKRMGSTTHADYWESTQDGWKQVGTPPSCPDPQEFSSFTDVRYATSVLYPGQMRSVGYENTSGFRFDGLANDAIIIVAPIDGEVVQAARFLVDGELQYVFDILHPCGIMVRFDHLLELFPKYMEIVEKLPQPKENDSRSTFVYPPVKVIKGEVIATAVGIGANNNTFVAWTMFDFNKKNKISEDPSWSANHPVMDHYVICPFEYLPAEDQERVKSLPAADSMSGYKSDFCK